MSTKYTTKDYWFTFIAPGGQIRCSQNYISVNALATKTIASIVGKGKIISGIIYPPLGTDQKQSYIRLFADGIQLNFPPLYHMHDYGLYIPVNHPIRLAKYDTDKNYYVVDVLEGISYNESFSVQYEEKNNYSVTVECDIIYFEV